MEPFSTLDQASPETGATANLAASVRFPGEDGGHSLAEMAERDLDAALQLLADRAQYITGASGAAIAIRRDGKNDMLCRASAGMNAPELGALLSTEFGLSGESVRTRQALRCDDAERDQRVNREVCREMGIASVVVMPVVNDDEVLGVFELFSGKANAFGARDVSAVQRLSEMVETAVRLAQAAQNLPERLMGALSGPAVEEAGAAFVEVDEVEVEVQAEVQEDHVLEGQVVADVLAQDQVLADPEKAPAPSPESTAQKKALLWSAVLNPAGDADKTEEPDQSHVPPVLRSLRKCVACGFPVTAGRMLCVECEEKKWRGQLRSSLRKSAIPPEDALGTDAKPAARPAAKPEAKAFAAAAGSHEPTARSSSAAVARTSGRGTGPEAAAPSLETPPSVSSSAQSLVSSVPSLVAASAAPSIQLPVAFPEFVLSAGLEPSQSWLAANKYIVGVLLLIAAAAAAVFLMR